MKRNLTSKVAISMAEKRKEEALKAQIKEESRIENEALKAELLSEIKGGKNISKKENTSHKQQILILHYLGILDQHNITNVKKGLLFSKLLNKNDKNTENYIRYVDGKIDEKGIKTRNNLVYVYNLFEDLGLNNEAAKAKADIDKLKID